MKFKVDSSTILITFIILGMFLFPIPWVIFAISVVMIFPGIGINQSGFAPVTFFEGVVICVLLVLYIWLIVHLFKCIVAIFNKNCKCITVNSDKILLEHKKLGNIELNYNDISDIQSKKRGIIGGKRRIGIITKGRIGTTIYFYEISILTKDNQKYTIAISDYDKFSNEIASRVRLYAPLQINNYWCK